MEIVTMPVRDLVPADYNPREEATPGTRLFSDLEASLSRFGLVVPIVWNRRSGTVVGGHQRLRVLVANGVEEVPVSVVDVDETDEKAMNLALNRILGGWVWPRLKGQIVELRGFGEDALLGTGFNKVEVGHIAEFRPKEILPVAGPGAGRRFQGAVQPTTVDTLAGATVAIVCPECGHIFQIGEPEDAEFEEVEEDEDL